MRQHKETIFFGLSVRQFVCAALAVGIAAGVYLLLGSVIGQETASWVCILCAAPMAVAGFFQYNGMPFEKFLWVFLKSEFLCAGNRVYKPENFYYKLLEAKGGKNEKIVFHAGKFYFPAFQSAGIPLTRDRKTLLQRGNEND